MFVPKIGLTVPRRSVGPMINKGFKIHGFHPVKDEIEKHLFNPIAIRLKIQLHILQLDHHF